MRYLTWGNRNNRLPSQRKRKKRILFPVWRQLARSLVVTSKTVNTGFDQNQTVLAVLVLAVTLQVLADGDGLLDQVVKVLRDLGSQTVGLEDTKDLVASDRFHLRNAMGVTENDTNLSR